MNRSAQLFGKDLPKLQALTVAIVGVGALGSVSAELLARAGIKKLILIDRDLVDASNLERQQYDREAIGKPKVLGLAEKLGSFCEVETHFIDLNHTNIDVLNADIIVDGTDNTLTRLLINDYCLKNNLPWVYGSAIREEGYVQFIDSPCFEAIMQPASLETCEGSGVMNTITHLIACLQVQRIYEFVRGKKETRLLHVDLTKNTFDFIEVPLSEKTQYPYLEGKGEQKSKLCGTNSWQFYTDVDYALFARQEGVKDLGFGLKKGDVLVLKDGRVLVHANNEKEAKTKIDSIVGR